MKRPITLKKVSVHNLQAVDLTLETGELIAFTGVSGSGKSSLAFDTIFIEGQRRYIESLSTYARRYLGDMSKPDVEHVSGLSPTIAIEQKSAGKNPRSTVGTLTEIYDYLRVLYARVALPHCPVSGEPVSPESKERIIKTIQGYPSGTKLMILAPVAKGKKGEFKDDLAYFLRRGFTRARVDGVLVDLEEELHLDKNLAHDIDLVIDRLIMNEENQSRAAESVMSALDIGKGMLTILEMESQNETLFSTHAYSKGSGIYYSSLEPHDFSFNSPSGMCPACHGLGFTQEFQLETIIDPEKSIAEDCCALASSYQTVRFGNIYNNLAKLYDFDVHTPWKDLPDRAKRVFLEGTEKKWVQMHFVHPVHHRTWTDYVQWRGVLHEAKSRFAEAKSESYRKKMREWMHEQICPECQGSKLRAYPAAAQLKGARIHDLTALPLEKLALFFEELALEPQELQIAEELLKEIVDRIQFLLDVGLQYLSLDRAAPTLSGGEAQRVRLASQVGCGLVGVTYVLDEPSIGLHPRDNKKLIRTLKQLRDMGNTVIVVEHDEETMRAADRIVDFGPGPGVLGGQILVNGSIQELLAHPESITAKYLSGRESIEIPHLRRKPGKDKIEILGASQNNLKGVNATFPLHLFLTITGVSGSGKSSLIIDTLYPALANHLHHAEHKVGCHKKIKGVEKIDKVIAIDQSPIGRTPRSNPATYIKIFDEIRTLFTQLPESVVRGYTPGRFSFNVRHGSCAQCLGMGMIRVDMDFLEDQWVPCGVCRGMRFDQETLSIRYKGKNIHEVLKMTIAEAADFFANIPSLKRKLDVIARVGLEYIELGQPSTTLSGGEAQRIKLAKELVRPGTGKTLYILDEPTTGLHFHDIKALLAVLHELVDRGNTVLLIEHNMDVVKTADWILDLGPEGGEGGGEILAEGSPEKLAKMQTPTGEALRAALGPKPDLNPEITSSPHGKEVQAITVKGAEQNNLKHLNLSIPRGKLTVCTGPSGSGKSSLAFETIYAEGQRRYIESLSPYARQFVKQMPKPKLSQIEGLSPAIAIEQKAAAGNPRSTIGTMTEIYDYLRILFAQAGTPHCPESGERIESITPEYVSDKIMEYPEGEKITLLAPLAIRKGEAFEDLIARLQQQGFVRIRLGEEIYELDESIPYDRLRKQTLALVIDRIKVGPRSESRLRQAVESAALIGEGKLLAAREEGDVLFNLAFAVPSTGKSYPEITPHTFSFNSAEGMCLECAGLGYQYGAHLESHPEVMTLSTLGLLRELWSENRIAVFNQLLKKRGIDPKIRLSELSEKERSFLFKGSHEIHEGPGYRFEWLGFEPILAKAGRIARSNIRTPLLKLLDEIVCPTCQGSRLTSLARHVTLGPHSIDSLCRIPLHEALDFLKTLRLPPKQQKVLEEVLKQLIERLLFLNKVGLGYITLDRRAPTLSNGEAQRIRLARQLGSSLTGMLYVLDEPTIGLHPHDNAQLNDALLTLKELGNTLLLVEHDPQTVATADYLLDFGPGAGHLGGHITARGSYDEVLANPNSLTGAYLSGRKTVTKRKKRRQAKAHFPVEAAALNNLKNISIALPIGVMTALTGVSGSGKSTLMHEVIRPKVRALLDEGEPFNKLIVIDQNPIGHTVRSDVGTYVEVLTHLRTFYASLGGARTRGLQPHHFSYNHRKGMCTRCWGLGYRKIEMLFLPPVKLECDQCNGMRLNPLSLEVEYHGMSFGELLCLTVNQALEAFALLPKVTRILKTLQSVGLGYLKLGQEIATLSGGEAQRMKLSRELSKRGTGKTLYLLDEPTTGLHPDDIEKLLNLLHRLVDKGNTLLVIEHNIEMIQSCDFLIDLGPGAGEAGGEIVATGTPEEVAEHPHSLTGSYL